MAPKTAPLAAAGKFASKAIEKTEGIGEIDRKNEFAFFPKDDYDMRWHPTGRPVLLTCK